MKIFSYLLIALFLTSVLAGGDSSVLGVQTFPCKVVPSDGKSISIFDVRA